MFSRGESCRVTIEHSLESAFGLEQLLRSTGRLFMLQVSRESLFRREREAHTC